MTTEESAGDVLSLFITPRAPMSLERREEKCNFHHQFGMLKGVALSFVVSKCIHHPNENHPGY